MNITFQYLTQAGLRSLFSMALLASTLPMRSAVAQEANPVTKGSEVTISTNAVAAPNVSNSAAKSADKETPAYSRGLGDVVKMAESGVSSTILLAFVENSSIVYSPSATEIVTLKQKGVSDEVITAILKRGAEVRTVLAQAQSRGTVAAPAIVRTLSTDGDLNPESYDFWYYHYAYPRALSESYRMLAPYYPGNSQGYGPSYNQGYTIYSAPSYTTYPRYRTSGFPASNLRPSGLTPTRALNGNIVGGAIRSSFR